MIGRNAEHPADGRRARFDVRAYERDMRGDFKRAYRRVKASPEGRKALARYRKFWGIMPTEIRDVDVPGTGRGRIVVGMGKAGKGKIWMPDGRKVPARGAKLVACDATGRRIMLLTGKSSRAPKARLREVGVAEETHYIPTADQEKARTFKRNAYWVHRHDDDGGKFPKVFRDQAGNYRYGPGTYTVTDWIRR
jgi:hypothetical protein